MSAMDRIFAKLLGEMADLEELVKKCNGKETDLITKHVVIAYRVDGEDRFLTLDQTDIMRVIEEQAKRLRRDLHTHGKCDATAED